MARVMACAIVRAKVRAMVRAKVLPDPGKCAFIHFARGIGRATPAKSHKASYRSARTKRSRPA
ncbi:hypothetical protein [uncultured Murdochiella sp.]|uniref:hypothetical protein n=1 Tax=uncultured Murdochiella sp. TaxID=1586095 RepID=UPI0028042B5E|nr:hypothetical protein [uncultured Murdochiella sp.]